MIDTPIVQQASAAYPRVYSPKRYWQARAVVFAVVFGLPAAVGAMYCATGHPARNHSAALHLAVISAVLALITAYCVGWSRVARITLWPDRIEIRGLFRSQALPRHDILGIRTDSSVQDTGRIIFELRGGTQLSISRAYDFDDIFQEWVLSFKNLDLEEQHASEEAIIGNERFGRRRLDRVHALRRAKRISSWFAFGSFLLFLWGSVIRVPESLSIVALVLCPWLAVALAARSRGLYSFDPNRSDARPILLFPYILPGIALMMRAFWDMKLLDWKAPFYLTMGIASLLAIVASIANRPIKKGIGRSVFLFVFALPYAFGASMEGNILLDRSEPQTYRARVMEKEKHKPRDSFYYLHLAPWGPRQTPDRVGVLWTLYDSTQVGGDVCLTLRRGAFRVHWYKVHECGSDE